MNVRNTAGLLTVVSTVNPVRRLVMSSLSEFWRLTTHVGNAVLMAWLLSPVSVQRVPR